MAYITINDIYNRIDQVNVQAMLADYGVNTSNDNSSIILTNILQAASDQCDALVSSVYNTPFNGPVPVKIYQAAIVFACEMLYQRRLTPAEKNPMTPQADHWRDTLIKINSGELSLDANFVREVPPVISKTHYNRANTNIY